MRILFAISLVALAALLWASVSIAQHIYRSRSRHKSAAREANTQPASSAQLRTSTPAGAPTTPALHDSETQHRKAS